MSENLLQLMFKADTGDLDTAKEKLVDLGSHMPTVGEGIEGLAKSFMSIPGPVGAAVAAIGGMGVALTEMVEHSLEAGQQLLELSDAVGIPVEKLQPLIEVLGMAGIESTRAQASFQKLAQSVGTALSDPTGKAADEFKKLGISQEELKKGDITQILQDTAAGFAKYSDSAQKTAAMRDLLGRQGPEIVAAMNDEANSVAHVTEVMNEYGASLTTADAVADKKFNATISLSMQMFTGLGNSITKDLLPTLQLLATWFEQSGEKGGQMHDLLEKVGAIAGVVGRLLIQVLVEPIMMVSATFEEAGVVVRKVGEAFTDVAHGQFTDAKNAMIAMNDEINKINKSNIDAIRELDDSLDGLSPVLVTAKKATEDTGQAFGAFNANANKIADTLDQLKTKATEQISIWEASAAGLDSYKKAQDNVAIGTELLKLKLEGASKAVLEQAETYLRAEEAAKQNTSAQVSGLQEVARLQTQMGTLISHNTELEKAQAEIKANPGMLESTKQELLADAQLVDAKKQQIEVDKEIAAADASVLKDSQQQITAMTLGTDALKKYNTEAKLLATLNKEMIGKTPQQMVQLTNDYNKNVTAIEANTTAVKNFQTSWAGAQAGGVQAMANLYSSATNLNTMGSQLTTTFVNGLTTAFTTMGQSGKNAFATLTTALITFVEQAIIKFLILKAMIAAMEAMGVSAATINLMLGKGTVTASANGNAFSGGSVTPFADGGIVGGPTMVPMALMGEAGPEAVMPLQRSSTGKLGVALNGDSGGGPQTVNHNYGGYVVVNTNQDPHETGKQIKKQMNNMKLVSQGQIAKSQRPGGISNRPQGMFAR